MSFSSGHFDGIINGDHTVPAGALIMECKKCENCPATFVRQRCTCPVEFREVDCGSEFDAAGFGIICRSGNSKLRVHNCSCPKYCFECRGRVLLPPLERIQSDYRDSIPTGAKVGGLPHYDNSLVEGAAPVKKRELWRKKREPKPRIAQHFDWRKALREEIANR